MRNHHSLYKSTVGFTLMELMFVMVIFAILTSMVLPSIEYRRVRLAIHEQSESLSAFLKVAKFNAIVRKVPVQLCSRPLESEGCGSVSDWANGWNLYFQANNIQNVLLQTYEVQHVRTIVTTVAPPTNRVNYEANGFASTIQVNFCSTIPHLNTKHARAVQLSSSGDVFILKGNEVPCL